MVGLSCCTAGSRCSFVFNLSSGSRSTRYVAVRPRSCPSVGVVPKSSDVLVVFFCFCFAVLSLVNEVAIMLQCCRKQARLLFGAIFLSFCCYRCSCLLAEGAGSNRGEGRILLLALPKSHFRASNVRRQLTNESNLEIQGCLRGYAFISEPSTNSWRITGSKGGSLIRTT